MRHLTLTIVDNIRGDNLVHLLQTQYRPFDKIETVAQSNSKIYRWYSINESFVDRVIQTVFDIPEVGSLTLSKIGRV